MENNLGYVTHRKKLLDFIITDLKQSFGDKYTQLTKDYSIQNALEDFLYCTNNGEFEILLDGKEINPKRISVLSVSENSTDSWIFTFPFNNKDIKLTINFKIKNNGLVADYVIETDDSNLDKSIIGRNISIFSHVESKLIFDNQISFEWNDIKKAYVSDIEIPEVYVGGSYIVEFDGQRYSDLQMLKLNEDSYFLGGGESWDNACQKIELIGSNGKTDYSDIHSAVLLTSPDIYRYDELHSLKVWEVREFVHKIDSKFIPRDDYTDETMTFKNIIVTGDGVVNHLVVDDSCTVPNPSGNNDAVNKLYFEENQNLIKGDSDPYEGTCYYLKGYDNGFKIYPNGDVRASDIRVVGDIALARKIEGGHEFILTNSLDENSPIGSVLSIETTDNGNQVPILCSANPYRDDMLANKGYVDSLHPIIPVENNEQITAQISKTGIVKLSLTQIVNAMRKGIVPKVVIKENYTISSSNVSRTSIVDLTSMMSNADDSSITITGTSPKFSITLIMTANSDTLTINPISN